MWIVAKIKKKEISTFKQKLVEKFGRETKFYYPKIKYNKFIKNKVKEFEKHILENYIFCYNKRFVNPSFVSESRFLKGLEYFLTGYSQNQKEIVKFIDYCKSFETKDGYLVSAFFKEIIKKRAIFISGPFTDMIFEILERQKNKLKILVGNIVTTISDDGNYLYRSV
tara:strand:- start:56 stop:556 length:501 start_codon:yes stop_codon:yes gene_type:complete